MTEVQMADTPQEGLLTPTGPDVESGNDNPEASPPKTNETDESPSPEGEEENNTPDDTNPGEGQKPETGKKNVPFHEHPRWIERESEWEEKFNKQESRHQEDMKDLREEMEAKLGQKNPPAKENQEVPQWFGGGKQDDATKQAWSEYQDHQKKLVEDAKKQALEEFQGRQTEKSKAVQEATAYMESEVKAIESDKTLNPTGSKIDIPKLVKFAMDNNLHDGKNWNYRTAYELMKAREGSKPAPAKPASDERKQVADSTSTRNEPQSEPKPKSYKTTEDFETGGRPW